MHSLGLSELSETVLLQLDFTALLRERTPLATQSYKAIVCSIRTNAVVSTHSLAVANLDTSIK